MPNQQQQHNTQNGRNPFYSAFFCLILCITFCHHNVCINHSLYSNRWPLSNVSAVHAQVVSYFCHSYSQTGSALGRFIPGTNLIVIQHVFLSYRYRRKVGHHDISTCLNPQLPSSWMNGAQSGRCRKKNRRVQDTNH